MSRRLGGRGGDEGAFAILYAVAIVALVAIVGLVVDSAAQRSDRRSNRSAADAGALAGATSLALNVPDPITACTRAMRYTEASLGYFRSGAGTDNCASVFALQAAYTDQSQQCQAWITAGTPGTAYEDIRGHHIQVTWPVLDGSNFMTNPDVEHWPGSSSLTQIGIATSDGSACRRLAVDIFQTRGQAFGGGSNTTESRSVALGGLVVRGRDQIAALNVLDPHHCDAVQVNGQGGITVKAVLDSSVTPPKWYPGIISVESDGHDSGNTCPNNRPWVIDPQQNGGAAGNAFINAEGPNGVHGGGKILSWAVTQNNAKAYDATLPPQTLAPLPTALLPGPQGTQPVTDRFGCVTGAASGCRSLTPPPYIQNLVNAFGSGTPPSIYAASEPPYNDGTLMPFRTLPGDPLVSNFQCTTQSSDPTIVVPPGNWFVNCPSGFSVGNVTVFQGGNIVFSGGVNVAGSSGSGCLAINVPTNSCPTTDATPPTKVIPDAAGDSIVYIRTGQFAKGSQAQLYMPRTFVYQNVPTTGNPCGNGSQPQCLNFGAGSGTLFWSNPRPYEVPASPVSGAVFCASDDDPCRYSKFSGLSFWSDTTLGMSMAGQSNLFLRGVLFTPSSLFHFTGQTGVNQTFAQFWSYDLLVDGQGGLTMAPDPKDSVPSIAATSSLIR